MRWDRLVQFAADFRRGSMRLTLAFVTMGTLLQAVAQVIRKRKIGLHMGAIREAHAIRRSLRSLTQTSIVCSVPGRITPENAADRLRPLRFWSITSCTFRRRTKTL